MMNFVILTLSFTVASLLASGIMMVVVFKLLNSPKVVKWYAKWFVKQMKSYETMFEELNEEFEEEI